VRAWAKDCSDPRIPLKDETFGEGFEMWTGMEGIEDTEVIIEGIDEEH